MLISRKSLLQEKVGGWGAPIGSIILIATFVRHEERPLFFSVISIIPHIHIQVH